MEVVLAEPLDLVEILYLISQCVIDMNEKGEMQWNTVTPSAHTIIDEIKKKNIYLVKDKGVCKGLLNITDIQPEHYKEINWGSNTSKVLYIRYMAIHPYWLNKGIDKLLIEFAEKYAKKNNFTNIRLSAFQNNQLKTNFYNQEKYQKKGEFFDQYQKTPFVCYEKKIK